MDENGTTVPENGQVIRLEVNGDAKVLNTVPLKAEAGVATALIRIGNRPGPLSIIARSDGLKSDSLTVFSK